MATESDEAKRQQIDAIYKRSRQSFPDVPELSAVELKDRQAAGDIVLVDVRAAEEQAVSMIPGAITSGQFEQNQADYAGKPVAVYCTVGHRSGLYAKQLQAQGWNVFNIPGAILSWTHAGGELVNTDGPTHKVHVCSRRTDLAAEGYEPVW